MKLFKVLFILLFFPFFSPGQSAENKTTIILFDSTFTPARYNITYLSGDYNHQVFGIDTMLTGKIIGKNKSGKIFFQLNLENGIFNGEQKYFYKNGNTYQIAHFENGLFTGEYLSYYPSGKLLEKYYYKNGVQDGVQTGYWENGNKNVEEIWVNGIQKSERYWYENGEPQH